jgi:hypothetical protein
LPALLRASLFLLIFLLACNQNKRSSAMAEKTSLNLPQSVGAWTRASGPRLVGPREIFDYMDGAGELYLGYRFKFLEVHRYDGPDQNEILVEIYWMETPEDAYGLLSGDWGGEPVDLGAGAPALQAASAATAGSSERPRALYGAGLLRLRSGNLFARVMATQETAASTNAVYALGRAIAAGRPASPEPALALALPGRIGARVKLRRDRVTYLRSHLVLNSVYFLSSANLLDLGPGCEMVAAAYGADRDKRGKPARLLLARYPDERAAEEALKHFRNLYLPEKRQTKAAPAGSFAVFAIEDGWMGFSRTGRSLALVFEAGDESTARLFLEEATRALQAMKE